jgi:SAM-dependent methyltransferase
MTVVMRPRAGAPIPLDTPLWCGPASDAEVAMLTCVDDPVLDLGCGPGRLVTALAERGRAALGIDTSPTATALAGVDGATVLCRSIFDRLPGEGRWRTILLLDGNVGIGGDPERLLTRVASLLAAGGMVLVEVEPPGTSSRIDEARLEAHGWRGPWFPWAWVSADDLPAIASTASLRPVRWHRPDQRWVTALEAARQ